MCLHLKIHPLSSERRTELESANFECIWLWIRPPRLPRPLHVTGIILCIVYNPSDHSAQELRDLDKYLVNTTDSLCGLAILGDFNNFGAPNLLSGHNLKQVVHLPTRGSATLDLIITNLHTLYDKLRFLAPLGSGDHSIVLWLPIAKDSTSQENITKPMKYLVRRYPLSQVNAFGRRLCTHNWFSDVGPSPLADEMAVSFSYHLTYAQDRFFPLKSVKCHYSDKP